MATVKRKQGDAQEKIVISMMELVLQNADRSRADIAKWWNALQQAEQISYPNRSKLYDLYDRVKMDGYLSGIISKRIDAVLNKNLHYEVNNKRVDELDNLIQSSAFRNFIKHLFKKKFEGLIGFEFPVGPDEFTYKIIPVKHIKPEVNIIAEHQSGFEGIDYTDVWNIMVLQDETDRFGLLLKCCPYAILKSGSISDLAQYIELFGQPMRIGKYDAADVETKKELKRAMKEAGSSLSMTIPSQAQIEIIGDNVTNGNGDVHKVMFTTCNNEMGIIILGNTETTSNDNGGSNAKSKVQADQQLEITKSDMKEIANILSSKQFKKILQSFGYPISPDDNGLFVYEQEVDLEELKSKKDIWLAVSAKVPVADDDWYKTFNMPKPDNYDELKAKMEEEKLAKLTPPPAPAPAPAPAKKQKLKPKNQFDDEEFGDKVSLLKRMFRFFEQALKVQG